MLAAGNGAPDVFSAVSGLDSQSDFGVTLGLLLGSSIFTTTVILASVLLATQQAQKAVIVPGAFVRDVCAYIVTTVSILIICSDGKVWLYETLSLLCCYVAYLAVIVCSHYHSTAASLASELDYEDENEDKDEEVIRRAGSSITKMGGRKNNVQFFFVVVVVGLFMRALSRIWRVY